MDKTESDESRRFVPSSRRRGFMAALGAVAGTTALGQSASGNRAKGGPPRNLILLIPDGSSRTIDTAARYYRAADEDLTAFPGNVDSVEMGIDRADHVGSISTYPDDPGQLITDSAAAGTAISTGHKTTAGSVGVDSDGNHLKTIVERANDAGYATGLVTTSMMTHGTPASFAAHVEDRENQDEIARQYIDEQDVDVLLGGDRSHFDPDAFDGRTDGRNLITDAQERGYQYVETAAELDDIEDGKVLGLFTEWSHLGFALDRQSGSEYPTRFPISAEDELSEQVLDGDIEDTHFGASPSTSLLGNPVWDDDVDEQPGLVEMAAKAIELLEQRSENGFFLMIEGARVDHLGHLNNFAIIPEQVEHDDAVHLAMDYAEKTNERGPAKTSVVNVSDHDCGGLSLGNSAQFDDMDWETIVEQEATHWPNFARVQAINARAGLDFSSIYHTTEDVPLYAAGANSELFAGHQENNDLIDGMAAHLRL